MESPKPNHAKLKESTHIMKLADGRYGLLGFNNMLPVPKSELSQIDINAILDHSYAGLLHRQIAFINRNKAVVLSRAAKTYFKAVNAKPGNYSNVCCNFRKLEAACSRYNPSHNSK